MKQKNSIRLPVATLFAAALALCAVSAPGLAQSSAAATAAAGAGSVSGDAGSNGNGSINSGSELEEVTVYAPQPNGQSLGGSTVTQTDMREFDRNTLDDAVQLASGTSISEVGARNETDVWIRGFDRWRVPLYQDGIPIYLPVDNRIDFGRFTTMDISQIQISKGFASVIDGPGAMGGAINIVSRVVTQPQELDARVGATFDSNGAYNGTVDDVFVGTRQADWYLQGAGSFDKQSHFRLSNDFTPGTLQGPGDRIDSAHEDYKINLKAGYLPNQASDYSINFIDQIGSKDNPPPDSVIPAADMSQVKYWTWPAWDYQSGYWLSQNEFDDRGSFLKTRLYYERFYNVLNSYDSITYSTMNTPKAFISTYDDRASGAIVEGDENLPGNADTIRGSAQYRWDEHNETEGTRNAPGAPRYQEPWETALENTSSFALENIYHPSSQWSLTAGVSYDLRHLAGDSEWVSSGTTPPYGYSYAYPVADKDALNGELALVRQYSDTGAVHISYADRARFPTLFEMYSTRFSTFQNNPDLQAERSHYTEAGIADTVAEIHLVANVFYARVDHAIEAVALTPAVSEDENVGAERREGFEIELTRKLFSSLTVGANYSDLARIITGGPPTPPTDTPNHKFFGYLDWQPVPSLDIVPSVDAESKRWLQGAVNNLLYYQGGAFTLIGLKAAYRPTRQLELELGVTNLTDENYVIEDGYNAPGREYFANLRFTL